MMLGLRLVRASLPRLSPRCRPVRHASSYLLRTAVGDESERLDVQHHMVLKMMHQSILHPSLPKPPKHIADVATGNGTWPLDVGSRLPDSTLHGFDISPKLFPTTSTAANVDFSIHNFYNPFPAEHVGKYDLVHARFLMLAVQGADLQPAMENILSLLKPGGYLQWEEYDFQAQLDALTSSPVGDTWRGLLTWVAKCGYHLQCAESVRKAAVAAGMEVLGTENFSTRGLGFLEEHYLTLVYAVETGVPRQFLKSTGKTDEEIEGVLEACRGDLERGVLPHYFLSRVLCRKPVS